MTSVQIGRNHIHLESVDSTNDYAMNLISKTNPIDGTVISASYQAKGKGQFGRSWSSDYNKNIIASIILESSFLPIQRQFDISIAVSVGITRFVEEVTGFTANIKWPNDIYINNKKLSGILIQNILSGKTLKYCVIGIGINIFQKSFPSNATNPVSLFSVCNIEDDLRSLYKKLFIQLDKVIKELKNGKIIKLREEYLSKMYKRYEMAVFIDQYGDKFEASIAGISEEGKLKLLMNGNTILCALNEAKMSL